jgi:hypothetical protein
MRLAVNRSLEAPLAEEGATSLRKRQAPEADFRLLARPAWGADPPTRAMIGHDSPRRLPRLQPVLEEGLIGAPLVGALWG